MSPDLDRLPIFDAKTKPALDKLELPAELRQLASASSPVVPAIV